MTGLELPQYDRAGGAVELVVAGAGPSGLAVADRVSQAGAPLALGGLIRVSQVPWLPASGAVELLVACAGPIRLAVADSGSQASPRPRSRSPEQV